MRYFIIAGEASGDLHASHLMRELKCRDDSAEFSYFGGDLMRLEGGRLLKHYSEMAFMGLTNVVMNLPKIFKNFRYAKREVLAFSPDVLILVDYPGFNLRMAGFAKRHGIRTFYYISPKIWAWNTGRVRKIKRYVDEMFTIFPFETAFYKRHGYKVRYVGNPTIDELAVRPNQDEPFESFIARNSLPAKPIVAILAGSRKQEISLILPEMAGAAEHFHDYQFVIAGVDSQPLSFYRKVLRGKDIPVVFGQAYELLQHSKASLVASGTANLEAAVINTPQVLCYKVELGRFAKWVLSHIMKVPYISLVNLILGREALKEYFQDKCNRESIAAELRKILYDKGHRDGILASYDEIRDVLGEAGSAGRAAEEMIGILKSGKV